MAAANPFIAYENTVCVVKFDDGKIDLKGTFKTSGGGGGDYNDGIFIEFEKPIQTSEFDSNSKGENARKCEPIRFRVMTSKESLEVTSKVKTAAEGMFEKFKKVKIGKLYKVNDSHEVFYEIELEEVKIDKPNPDSDEYTLTYSEGNFQAFLVKEDGTKGGAVEAKTMVCTIKHADGSETS